MKNKQTRFTEPADVNGADGRYIPKGQRNISNNPLGCNVICNNRESCSSCPVQKCFDKLAEYENAEEAGELIQFPAAVGDTVYVDAETIRYQPEHEQRFLKGQIVSLAKSRRGVQIKIKITAKWQYSYWGHHDEDDAVRAKYFNYPGGSIGRTVFLSREEAEASCDLAENNLA